MVGLKSTKGKKPEKVVDKRSERDSDVSGARGARIHCMMLLGRRELDFNSKPTIASVSNYLIERALWASSLVHFRIASKSRVS